MRTILSLVLNFAKDQIERRMFHHLLVPPKSSLKKTEHASLFLNNLNLVNK